MHTSRGITKIIVWALFVLLFIYVILRAIFVPLQHDEVTTYFNYIHSSNFIPPFAIWDANNHILNSLFTLISYHILGNEPWMLRFPNIVFFPIYYWTAWALIKHFKSSLVKWGCFLAIVCAHYIIDYFSQTRGYGISMALFLVALYCGVNFLKYAKKGYLFWIIGFSALATSANLTLIIASFLLIGYCLMVQLIEERFSRKTFVHVILYICMTALLFTPFLWFSFSLKNTGALYYGGMDGFWKFTGSSLSNYFVGYYNLPLAVGYSFVFLAICYLATMLFLKSKKVTRKFSHPSLLFSALLFGSIVSIFFMRYCMQVNFPEDRTAIYLYPLFIFSIAFTIEDWMPFISKYFRFAAVFLHYIPLHFIGSINLHTTIFPMEDNPPLSYFNFIREAPQESFEYPPTVAGYKMTRLCWSLHNYKSGGFQNELSVSTFVDTIASYQLIDHRHEKPARFNQLYAPILKENNSPMTLYQRKKRLNFTKIGEKSASDLISSNYVEYYHLAEFDIPDSLQQKNFFIGYSGNIISNHSPFIARMVVAQFDDQGKEIHQESTQLDWQRKDWKGEYTYIRNGRIVPTIKQKKTTRIKLYLWDMNSQEYLLQKFHVELFVLE